MREVAYNVRQLAACARVAAGPSHSRLKLLPQLVRCAVRRRTARPHSLTIHGGYNTALRREAEVAETLQRLERLALAPHGDRAKSWDAFRAFSFIIEHGTAGAAVLDMGSSKYGRLLGWLHLYGFRDLHGCDLVFAEPFTQGAIEFSRQDIEATSYPSKRFDFVTCLSVIEHGVDPTRFFREVARILKPGGYLLLSTDYWETPLLQEPLYDDLYKADVHIFSRDEVDGLVACAAEQGLELVDPLDATCDERVVLWARLNLRFTFLFLAFHLRA
jgi:SAM-dependent methyltransferase